VITRTWRSRSLDVAVHLMARVPGGSGIEEARVVYEPSKHRPTLGIGMGKMLTVLTGHGHICGRLEENFRMLSELNCESESVGPLGSVSVWETLREFS
jgi:hypothetical protein